MTRRFHAVSSRPKVAVPSANPNGCLTRGNHVYEAVQAAFHSRPIAFEYETLSERRIYGF